MERPCRHLPTTSSLLRHGISFISCARCSRSRHRKPWPGRSGSSLIHRLRPSDQKHNRSDLNLFPREKYPRCKKEISPFSRSHSSCPPPPAQRREGSLPLLRLTVTSREQSVSRERLPR